MSTVTVETVFALIDKLATLSGIHGMNGPAQWLLTEMIAEDGIAIEDMTVRQLLGLIERHRVRYNALHDSIYGQRKCA